MTIRPRPARLGLIAGLALLLAPALCPGPAAANLQAPSAENSSIVGETPPTASPEAAGVHRGGQVAASGTAMPVPIGEPARSPQDAPPDGRPTPWEIVADTLFHYQDPEGIFAEGDVILSRPGSDLVIRADWMRYDVERGVVKSRGHVLMISSSEEIEADAATIHLDSQTGTLRSATIFLADQQFYIKGEEIDKTGEDSYFIRRGWFSACLPEEENCGKRPAWSIRSKEAEVTLDGMAHLHHATFQIKEQSVAYTPYMLFPVKTRRESGFLFPEWSHSSRDGFGFTLPYFINLSPSADITLYPSYLSARGLLAGAEFRYEGGPGSRGMFMLSLLKDDLVDTDVDDYKSDGLLRTNENRYWLRGKADHDFGENLVGRLDLDLVSDQDFIQEFRDGGQGWEEGNIEFKRMFERSLQEETLTDRESSLQLVKNWATMTLAGEMHIIQDVRNDRQLGAHNADGVLQPGEFTDLFRPTTPLQALPRLDFSGRTPIMSGRRPVSLAWNTEYVNYWRRRGIGAHRLDLHPKLITPMPRSGGWTEGKVSVGLRETAYQIQTNQGAAWEHERFQDRTGFDLEANLATLLMREFQLKPEVGSAWLEHLIRPNLIYNYLSRTQEKELPSLDGIDRLEMKNHLTYELNNYLELGGINLNEAGEESFWSREVATFQAAQTYNLREARRELVDPDERRREFSDLRFDLTASPWERLSFRYQTNLSMYGQGINRYHFTGDYTLEQGTSLSADYLYLKNSGMAEPYFYTTSGDSLHDLVASITSPLTETITVHGGLTTSLSDNHITEAALGLRYKPHCWMVDMEFRRYIDEKTFMIIFTLDGIGPAFDWAKDRI